ncbi:MULTISPECIES: choice-of-anchor K domain-containing protein [unclassified Microcoleus]|uniref:choice-of-anchor K domain-containing protein n=1 Tax=unclassified Microcoleus TaxID=2642155 RepID=UPI002FD6499E
MVNVNFNVWGKERIIESTPSTLGADGSALRFANPVGLLDIEEPYGTNPDENTYVIIHGFQNQGGNSKIDTGGNQNNQFIPETWMSERAKALREREPDANIILVDWEDGAKPALGLNIYNEAATNTREVGNQLAQYLKARNLDPNKIELMGHSLGAHVSGFAGTKYKELTGKELNRITGLDPAGPNFQTRIKTGNFRTVIVQGTLPGTFTTVPVLEEEPVPPSDRLDPGDAKRVVVLHTSSFLGNDLLLGNLDFFVNPNNFLQQPGNLPFLGAFGANHGYANELYTQLLKGNIFPQSDGSNFNYSRLSSPETGRIDVDTTKVFFEGSTSGTFDNGENKKILGEPRQGDTESYVQFDGRGSDGNEFSNDQEFSQAKGISTASDIPFNLGNLTYRNGITLQGSEPQGDFPLDVTLSLTNPVPSAQTFNFSFNLTVTENTTGDPVKDGDILRFSDTGISQEIIKFPGSFGDSGYRLELVGFSTDGGKTTLGRFDTPEQRLSDALLIAKIKPVSILEEATEEPIEAIKELPGNIKNKIGQTVNDFNGRVATFSKGLLDGLSVNVSGVLFPPPRVAQNLQASAEQNSTFQITEAVIAQYPGGLLGTENNDRIIGSSVTDVVLAARGADTLEGAAGGDYLLGGKGDDRILGEDANDILAGNKGNDFVSGGVADDLVRGGKGNDQIFGDDGEDILIGERGTDRLTGGGGSDIFILRTDTGTEETNPATADWLIDFNASEGDRIGINGGVPIDILTFTPADVNQDGIADTIIQYTETSEIFGVYTNIFGVVINTPPDIVKSSSFSIPLNDPITQIGML